MGTRGREAKKFRPGDPIKITSSLDTSAERGITREAKESEKERDKGRNEASRGYIKVSSSTSKKGYSEERVQSDIKISLSAYELEQP